MLRTVAILALLATAGCVSPSREVVYVEPKCEGIVIDAPRTAVASTMEAETNREMRLHQIRLFLETSPRRKATVGMVPPERGVRSPGMMLGTVALAAGLPPGPTQPVRAKDKEAGTGQAFPEGRRLVVDAKPEMFDWWIEVPVATQSPPANLPANEEQFDAFVPWSGCVEYRAKTVERTGATDVPALSSSPSNIYPGNCVPIPVPEPGRYYMIAFGLVALVLGARRRS